MPINNKPCKVAPPYRRIAPMLAFVIAAAISPAIANDAFIRKMPENKTLPVPSFKSGGLTWISLTELAEHAGFRHASSAFGRKHTFTNDRGSISFTQDNRFYTVDTATAIMPHPPVRIDQKLYLPAPSVVTAFRGKYAGTLSWNERSSTIIIDSVASAAGTSSPNVRTVSDSASSQNVRATGTAGTTSSPNVRTVSDSVSSPNPRTAGTSTVSTPNAQAADTSKAPAPNIQIPVDMSAIRTVVIDPGHGGKDPGALGPTGIKEKDVVLAISLELKRLLERAGLTVHMTRETDVFVPLRDRTNFANEKKADLFVSVHANSIGDRRRQATMRGYKIYFLSQAKNDEDKMAAMRENAVVEFEDGEERQNYGALQDVLISIAGAEYLRESQDLSIIMEQTFGASQRSIPRSQLGVGQANFWVLNGAYMPAVLVETGYISHPDEEKLLADRRIQAQLAAALSESIIKFKRMIETGQ